MRSLFMSEVAAIVIIITTTAAVAGLNIWLAVTPDKKTISQVIARWAVKHPIIPFVFGVLMGHWFWPVM